jgi:hypothetical protein
MVYAPLVDTLEGPLSPLRLNLIIRENNIDLLKYETAGNILVKSISIHKGDVQSALCKLSNYINKSNNLNLNVNFVVPPDQIKIFRKIPKSKNDIGNSYLAAKKILNEENDIDISKVYFDFISSKDIIEIGVVDKQKLLEAVSFIENTGFKVVNSISILNDQQKSFIFKSQNDFEEQSYYEYWLKGKKLLGSLKSRILSIKNLITSNFTRNLAFLSFALLTTVVLSTTYFDRSVEERRENVSTSKSSSAVSAMPNKKEREHTVFKPINIFVPAEKMNLSFAQDISLNKLPSLPNKIVTKNRSQKRMEIILNQEKNLNTLDISTVNIDNPWIQPYTLEEQFLLSKILEKNLAPSIQDDYRTGDPPIIFTDISLLFKNENKISAARLSLDAPLNKIRLHPKLRPNKYPFEIKEISKQYARPRVRPANITELAARSQIFSDTQIGSSVKPKGRPKIRKKNVVADYSGEGAEATVTGTISKSATKKSIAKLATTKNAINQRKLNLLSIYSRGSKKRAIVLFPTGQTKVVKVGDTLDGGRVAAIGTSEIRYSKGGNNLILRIPDG